MIHTGGGTYNPAEDRPCFFIAGDPQEAPRRYHLTAVNDARTDSEARISIDEPLERGSKLFLDSGVFNLTNNHMRLTGCTMDQALALPPEEITGFDELFDRYVALVNRYEPRIWGYVEIDQGGQDNKRRTRQRLHDIGINPIPVYHPLNDGWDYFDELAESYDRICLGNVVQAPPNVRVRLLYATWERRRRYPHLWIHTLGLTINEMLIGVPTDSCDSSTWCSALRWGKANLASSYLSRTVLPEMSRGFTYNRDVDRRDPGGWMSTALLYAAEFDMLTDQWRSITADRAAAGFDPWPAVLATEKEPRP